MEWLSGFIPSLIAGFALGMAFMANSKASRLEKEWEQSQGRADYSTELPRGTAHVLNYQHLWPSQFERAVRFVAQEEIAKALPKPEPKPMPVTIVTKES